MTITPTNWRAGFAALLASGVLLLGACSDGDDETSTDDESSEEDQSAQNEGGEGEGGEGEGETEGQAPEIDPDAPEADSEFCQGAMAAITMDVNPSTDPEDGDASLSAAEELEAPEEIAESWDMVLATSRQMAELDYQDPSAQEQAMAAYEEIAPHQARIIEYLQDSCGIDLGAGSETPPTGPASPDPTAGA